MRNGKQLIVLAISVAAIVLGLYMTFFNKKTEAGEADGAKEGRVIQQEESSEEGDQMNTLDYTSMELPMVENESAEERYNNGKTEIDIYFSNTAQLDQGKMPMEAQAVLCEGVQRYLMHSGYDDVTELYINDESYQENDEKITFVCFMDGYEEMLQIEYWFKEQTLKYYILNSDEYVTADTGAEE